MIAMMMLSSVSVMAQDRPERKKEGKKASVEQKVNRLEATVGDLSEEERQKIISVYTKREAAIKELKATGKKVKQQRKEARNSCNAELKLILGDERYEKIEAQRKERREENREKRKERRANKPGKQTVVAE